MNTPAKDTPDLPQFAHPELPTNWMTQAACKDVDTNIFFADCRNPCNARVAAKTCRGCPVRDECLDYAMAACIEFGVWGGLSPEARRTLRYGKRKPRQ